MLIGRIFVVIVAGFIFTNFEIYGARIGDECLIKMAKRILMKRDFKRGEFDKAVLNLNETKLKTGKTKIDLVQEIKAKKEKPTKISKQEPKEVAVVKVETKVKVEEKPKKKVKKKPRVVEFIPGTTGKHARKKPVERKGNRSGRRRFIPKKEKPSSPEAIDKFKNAFNGKPKLNVKIALQNFNDIGEGHSKIRKLIVGDLTAGKFNTKLKQNPELLEKYVEQGKSLLAQFNALESDLKNWQQTVEGDFQNIDMHIEVLKKASEGKYVPIGRLTDAFDYLKGVKER